MNGYLIIAGLIAAAGSLGHVSFGRKKILKPMLEVSFDPVSRKTVHCIYHYISIFSCLSAIMLLLMGLNIWPGTGTTSVIYFIAANYIASAILEIVLASTSDIPNGIFKLFHWIFFILLALFSLLGTI